MIVIVDDREMVTESYRALFVREGVAATGFTVDEFQGWLSSAPSDDILAISAFLIGEGTAAPNLAGLIRKRSAVAVIAMKEQKSLAETLAMFAGGVDDVVFKPCHAREILARIDAIMRRVREERESSGRASQIQVFRDGRDPLILGRSLQLPRRELRILEYLVANQSRRVSKAQIFTSVYGVLEQGLDECVIESHISKLRKRLCRILGYDPIDSKRHLGYQLIVRPTPDQQLQ